MRVYFFMFVVTEYQSTTKASRKKTKHKTLAPPPSPGSVSNPVPGWLYEGGLQCGELPPGPGLSIPSPRIFYLMLQKHTEAHTLTPHYFTRECTCSLFVQDFSSPSTRQTPILPSRPGIRLSRPVGPPSFHLFAPCSWLSCFQTHFNPNRI